MNVDTAIRLIDQLVYKPGWKFTGKDHTNRFEGTIILHVDYHAFASDRPDAEQGYKREIDTYAEFPIVVQNCDAEDLYFKILECIGEIEMHEAREFLRVFPSYWAPFHPHQVDGMRKWQDRTGRPMVQDLQFGIG